MSPSETYFITTPIYYVNDVPHVGHAYTTIAADALTRARRLRGRDAFLLTGTDEHGQNIERVAREKGLPTQEYCDRVAARFQALWQSLDIRYDAFIRTTDALHKKGVLRLWSRLREAIAPDGRPAIYEAKYSGWYCPRCEAFKDEDELRQPGNVCADHERPCEWTEEDNFFFRLSAYQDWLRGQIESDRLLIRPEGRRNEVLSLVAQGLTDFSVSRARVKWGIPVPEQPDHVLYVWFDALSNYITALGFADDGPLYRKYWASPNGERFHLIGKDIIRFHCVYWPALLHAAGVPVPNREFAQGWITKDGKKLSKTTGNVIDPEALVQHHGPDVVRYFLLREAPFGQDWDFTDTAFVGRYNADLANDLGNLVSRALTMVGRYCDAAVPPRPQRSPAAVAGLEELLQLDAARGERVEGVLDRYEALDFSGALGELWGWISQLNQRIVVTAPWELAKNADRRPELEAFLYRLLEAVRLVAVLVSPVVPRAATRVFGMLGLDAVAPSSDDLNWGRLAPGARLGRVEPLFPRIERDGTNAGSPGAKSTSVKEKKVEESRADERKAPEPSAGDDRIDIAEFARLDLRVARVTAAEKVPGSKKLVRLQVDIGGESRQVVAGIAESYEPDSLVGRSIVVVANLKPARLMGVESNGMLLAASLEGKPVLLRPEVDVPAGTKIK